MNVTILLAIAWVFAATVVAFLPMRRQYLPGSILLAAAPVKPPSSNPVVLKWHKKILRQEASEASRESRRQTNAIDLRLFRYRQVVVVVPYLHTHASNLFILSNDMKQTKISAAKSPAHIHSLRSIHVPYTVVIHFFPLLRYTVHAIEHMLRATV